MSVVINISKTYRKPIQTYSRLFELGASEKQNLAFLIGGCVISFVSQWPVQARHAFANQQSIDELMGAILLSNLFLLPLIFYFISMVMYIFAKGLGSNILGVELRMIIFWAYLAATPILLLVGIVEGFFGKKTKDFDIVKKGYKASAVPGTVAGLLDAHASFGKLPLEQILKPVIAQAINGIEVTYDLHKAIESSPQLQADPESRSIYYLDGKPIAVGSIMQRPDLAHTIELIALKGKAGFYEGEIAQKFISSMQKNNGFFTSDDFKTYTSYTSAPIVSSYRKNLVFTAGPPSGGGVVLLTALNFMSLFNFDENQNNATRTYHIMAEALRRGHNNRSHFIGDPKFFDVPIQELLSKDRILELHETFEMSKATPSSKIKPYSVKNESRDTTHYSIIDSDGNAVSNTYTLGYSFGSGVTIPGTGILMNNQMNNFAYRYGDASIKGRAASPANKFEPGKRPMSTMAPTMVFNEEGELMLITGSPGGSYIPAAILRVVSGVIDFKLGIGEATMLPRIHKDWPYSGLDYERQISSDSIKILQSIGHKPEANKTMGSTQSILIKENLVYGYADLRRPGAGIASQKN